MAKEQKIQNPIQQYLPELDDIVHVLRNALTASNASNSSDGVGDHDRSGAGGCRSLYIVVLDGQAVVMREDLKVGERISERAKQEKGSYSDVLLETVVAPPQTCSCDAERDGGQHPHDGVPTLSPHDALQVMLVLVELCPSVRGGYVIGGG